MGIKYALVVAKDNPLPNPRGTDEKYLTGLYQWAEIFDGDFFRFNELDSKALEYYDILHVNMCQKHVHLPRLIREKIGWNTDVKLVCNIDYAVEMLPGAFCNPDFSYVDVLNSLTDCDLVFCQEKYQAQLISSEIEGRVPVIPHPCNTRFIKRFYRYPFDREDEIVAMFHHEEDTLLLSSLASRKQGLRSVLLNFQPQFNKVYPGWFDDTVPPMTFTHYIDRLSRCRVAVENQMMHVHGRFVLDCACLGIPVVGSNYVDSINRLFPEYSCSPYNLKRQRFLVKSVLKDKPVTEDIIERVFNEVEYYNLANSKQRFMEELEDV